MLAEILRQRSEEAKKEIERRKEQERLHEQMLVEKRLRESEEEQRACWPAIKSFIENKLSEAADTGNTFVKFEFSSEEKGPLMWNSFRYQLNNRRIICKGVDDFVKKNGLSFRCDMTCSQHDSLEGCPETMWTDHYSSLSSLPHTGRQTDFIYTFEVTIVWG